MELFGIMSEETNKGGRPPHQPTDESRLLVKELYAAGVSRARIAERFGISDETLNKFYVEELDNSKERMASKKCMWHFRPSEYKSFSRGKYSIDQIRERHGSVTVRGKQQHQISAA